jgi:ABC-type transporter Mla subunit MlaD
VIEVREHLSERFDRARLALELRRSVRPAVVVAAGGAVALACIAFIISNVARDIYTPTQTVRFEVDSARAVRGGVQDVTFKGIGAGSIAKVELAGGHASITAKVEKTFGPVYRDARAMLRPRTVLQDMSLDIVDAGTRAAGEAGEDRPVPGAQTQTAVNVADVLQTFSPATRDRLARTLDELGGGLRDRGDDLRAAFVQVVPFLRGAGVLTGELAQRARLTRRLVHNSTLLTAELARREHDLRTLVGAGSETLGATAAGSPDVEATLAELPPTLGELDTSFAAVRGVLGDVDRAVIDLRPAADRLSGALSSLRSLSTAAAPAVLRLRDPVHRLRRLSDTLVPISGRLGETAAALRPQVGDIDHVTHTTTGCLYALDRFFQWTPLVFKMGDARGPSPRAYLTTGLGASSLTKDPNVFAGDSCAPGRPIGGEPGPGGGR